MDSGGILCLHYSFCSHIAVVSRVCHAPDVYPTGSAGGGRRENEMASPLGTFRRDLTLAAVSGDGF